MNLPDDFAIEPGGHVGVSGSRYDATPEALASLRFMIDQSAALGAHVLHHGCCTGWDEKSVPLAKKAGLLVAAHPPIDQKFFSQEAYNLSDVRNQPRGYHDRDMDIAFEVGVLLIGPRYPESHWDSKRSGTWLTTRYARSYGTRVYACNPNGDIIDVTENP